MKHCVKLLSRRENFRELADPSVGERTKCLRYRPIPHLRTADFPSLDYTVEHRVKLRVRRENLQRA